MCLDYNTFHISSHVFRPPQYLKKSSFSLTQIHEVQIKWMVDATVVVEDIVAQDLDHGLNGFSNSFY